MKHLASLQRTGLLGCPRTVLAPDWGGASTYEQRAVKTRFLRFPLTCNLPEVRALEVSGVA